MRLKKFEKFEKLNEVDSSSLILLAAGLLQLHNFKYVYGKDEKQLQNSPIIKTLNALADIAKITKQNIKDIVSPEVEEFLKKEDDKLK